MYSERVDPLPLPCANGARMITVASYNMRKAIGTDRLRRPERVLDVLCEIDADIVALQEADRRIGKRASAIPPELLQARSPYRPVPFDTRPDSIRVHGNALLVKRGIEIVDHAALPLPTLEPRGAVLADLRVDGALVRVVGMHLDLSGLWRRRQARAILHALEERGGDLPTVLMGDLNKWSQHGGCLRDFAHGHRFAHTGRSFHARRPVAALDRIIVSRNVTVIASGAHASAKARRASDHLPIWARLSFGPLGSGTVAARAAAAAARSSGGASPSP